MKKAFTTLLFFAIIFQSFAQEKGDNYLGLNIGTVKNTFSYQNSKDETKAASLGINYSRFLKENQRLILFGNFSKSDYETITNSLTPLNIKGRGYTVGVGFGQLFPLLKNFYAEFSPNLNYGFSKSTVTPKQNGDNNKVNSYNINLGGGLLWIPFKHFGLSINLASVNLSYNKQTYENATNGIETATRTSSGISLGNTGNFQNQSFTVFYKFK